MKHLEGEIDLKGWELDAFDKAQVMIKEIIAEATAEALNYGFEKIHSCLDFEFKKDQDPLTLIVSPALGEYDGDYVYYSCNLKDVVDAAFMWKEPTRDQARRLAQAMHALADYVDSRVEEIPEDWENEQ